MSLAISVYKNKNNFEASNEYLVDEITGEVYSLEPSTQLSKDQVVAFDSSLGNIEQIGQLREKINQIGSTSDKYDLIEKILRDGSHSGDVINLDEILKLVEQLEALKEEISKEKARYSDLYELVEILDKATKFALAESNPIVFV